MRVLTVVQRYNAVSEPWLRRMISGLGEDCVGVAGRTRADGGHDVLNPPFQRLRTRNVLHRLLPKSVRKLSPLRPASILVNFAKERGADTILCHYGTVATEYLEAWDRLKLPLFVHFHGYDLMFDMREQDGSEKAIHSPVYKEQIVRLSQQAIFIVNSHFSHDCLVEAGVASERIRVNYLGVETAPFHGRGADGRPRILYVGRFVDCKGPDLTIQAFNLLRQKGIDAELVMVGDGPLRDKCLQLRMESRFRDDILLPGAEDHASVQRRFAEASVFTMHSVKGAVSRQEEAFGVAFLDAMAVGLPVVTGHSGGIPEIVRHGETGYLFEPGNVEEHADYLMALLQDGERAERMGRAGREVAQIEFSQERTDLGLRRILTGQAK